MERETSQFLGHFDVGTDAQGNFDFLNLSPDADFYLYGQMGTMKELGALPVRQIHTGKDGEVTEVGDLMIEPAHRLAGRVVLADGQPVPPKTGLLISRKMFGIPRRSFSTRTAALRFPGFPRKSSTSVCASKVTKSPAPTGV